MLFGFLQSRLGSWVLCDLRWTRALPSYCGWKISCTTLDGWNPMTYELWDKPPIDWCSISSIHSMWSFAKGLWPGKVFLRPHWSCFCWGPDSISSSQMFNLTSFTWTAVISRSLTPMGPDLGSARQCQCCAVLRYQQALADLKNCSWAQLCVCLVWVRKSRQIQLLAGESWLKPSYELAISQRTAKAGPSPTSKVCACNLWSLIFPNGSWQRHGALTQTDTCHQLCTMTAEILHHLGMNGNDGWSHSEAILYMGG